MQLGLPFDPDPRLNLVRTRLLAVYGPQRDAERYDETSQWVNVTLSSRTLDAVSTLAFLRLRAFLPSWEALPQVRPEALMPLMTGVRWADAKVPWLIRASRLIRAQRGAVDLGFLSGWPVDAALAWLQRLPGIGPKGAATIVNFSSLRQRALALDTHSLRLVERLGFVPPRTGDGRAHAILMRLVGDWDADDLYELHWLLKSHGQRTCRPTWPACPTCPLRDLCPAPEGGAPRGTPPRGRR